MIIINLFKDIILTFASHHDIFYSAEEFQNSELVLGVNKTN